MKQIMSFWQAIMLFISIICLLLLLGSYLAYHTDPESFWPFHLLALAYPFLLLANILLLIFWITQMHWFTLVPLIIILTGWPQLTSFFGFNAFEKDHDNEGFKVMSYNVRNFDMYNWQHDVTSRDEIIEIIREADPDIICLQEFYESETGTFQTVKIFQEELGMPYFHIERTLTLRDQDHWGIAIFSKYPIETKKGIRFANSKYNSFLYSDINVEGRRIRVFNLHLQSIGLGTEEFKSIEKFTENQETDVKAAKTLAGKLKNAFIKRYSQANQVRKEMDASPHPVIVCGDFNATPASYSYHTISRDMQNAFEKKGFGIGNTYAGILPALRIDHIFLSQDFEILKYDTRKKEVSDHFPVIVSFSWKPQDPE